MRAKLRHVSVGPRIVSGHIVCPTCREEWILHFREAARKTAHRRQQLLRKGEIGCPVSDAQNTDT